MSFSIKKILPRTLFGRSLMILVIPVLLLQVIATYIFFDRHWDRMTARLAFAVAGEMALVAGQIEENPKPENIKRISGYAVQNLQFLISYEPDAALDVEAGKTARKSYIVRALDSAMQEQVRRPYSINTDVEEKWVEVGIALKDGLLRVSLPQRRLFSSSGYIFLLWMIGVSIILLAIAILFMRNQIRPIRRLAVVAERFGRGMDIPSSFKPEGAYEIRQASKAFIDMHGRIRRQIQQRTAMLAGVSHDLRTPLTRMKLQAAMLESSPDTEALKGDINDMERMINAYLDFVRGEGGEQAERTDLRVMLERIAGNLRRQGVAVALMAEPDLFVHVRPVAFERCVGNIVSNARKYAKNIHIFAGQTPENMVRLTVDDDGPGIPPDKFDDVFRPFYRVEESRNAATGGIGLGLPIAQDIVHGHGGRIWLEKSALGGLRVVIELPA